MATWSVWPWRWKMKVVRFSETSVTTHPIAERHVPEDLNLQQYRCENLKSRFCDNIWFVTAECWSSAELCVIYSEPCFEMWCWRRMEKISWTDCVRNEEVLRRVKEERSILQTIKGRKANWTGHGWHRNCFLKHVIEGKIEGRTEVTGIRGRRRK